MRRSSYSSLLVLFMIVTAACDSGGTGVGFAVDDRHTKPVDCPIELIRSEASITRKYEVVCTVRANPGTGLFGMANQDYAWKSVQEESCKCGGDAFIIDYEEHDRLAGFLGRAGVDGRVIRYTP